MNLIVFALKQEDELPEYNNYKKIYTGVGKINAAYSLTKAIRDHRPHLVINFGTAGGVTLKKGSFVLCRSFLQLDMDCTLLGEEKYKTPYDCYQDQKNSPIIGSSDKFLTYKNFDVDLVDMESYALKKICDLEKINFMCYKYITDECNEESNSDWVENLKTANIFYRKAMKDHENISNRRGL